MRDYCDCEQSSSKNYPKWSSIDVLWWKSFGGSDYLNKYKDGYILFHKEKIKEIASQYKIPAILLALVARTEAGGMPDYFKYNVLMARQFDYLGNDWMDNNLTITSRPEKTSMGVIAMQIRIVAKIFGKDPKNLSHTEIIYISNCLQKDNFNLTMVAQHLYDLIKYDYPKNNTLYLTDEQLIVVGSRYNRGTQRNFSDFISSINAKEGTLEREWTSYGRSMLKYKERVMRLLYGNVAK
ncbi:hypothetical protein ACFFL1_11720 [Samsonia erythrinae]|uniref:Uncharacterized protein n=1 Tax=Samsonia erythrinae TaxID=160434 RepID=A0A4R3VMA3_9GAMM|nr:hypothetical protein [Samsonia erythrinae]TCV05089.1 hypothetical protein EDC54_10775 [Samsonia erythrinae]